MSSISTTATAPFMIECVKIGEKFPIPFHKYSPEARLNAALVGFGRIINDACAGVTRKDFPVGPAGTDQFLEMCRRRVRVRLANLERADKPVAADPLDALSPEERAAVLAIREKNSKAA
jgi:hypothetical protein